MKRLYKLVTISFAGPFAMTFGIVLFLLVMQFLWRYIDELVGKGLELKVIGELLLYASSSLVPLALPLAVLLSSLMTFGSMGEYYELTAIKASGISLQRILVPIAIIVFFISVGAFFFSNNILPITNLKMKSLLFDVRQQRPEVQITEGVFYNGIDNYSIRVDKKNPVTNILHGIKIYDHTARKGNIKVTVADSGQIKMTTDKRNMIITLWNGYSYTETEDPKKKKNKTYPHELDKFREERSIIQLTGFELLRSDESIFKNSYQMLNISQLSHACDSLERQLTNESKTLFQARLGDTYFKSNVEMSQRTKNQQKNPVSAASVSAFPASEADDQKPTVRTGKMETNPGSNHRTGKNFQLISNNTPVDESDTIATNNLNLKPLKHINDFDSLYHSFNSIARLSFISSAATRTSTVQYEMINVNTNINSDTKYLRRHQIEWHRKFTLSFACLIFLFIGAPLGAIIRKGGLGMPTVISTILFILYYIISLTGEKFVRESVLTGFQGMWMSSFILIIAGIFLTYQATNDSAMLNIDTYLNWLREKSGLRKREILEKKTHIMGRFDLIDMPRNLLQSEFRKLSDMADECEKALFENMRWTVLINKIYTNTSYFHLIEFGIHYNSLLDQVILSKWFRIPYFQKRIAEFPVFDGRTTDRFLKYKYINKASVIIFPIGLIRLVILNIRIHRICRNLQQIMALSSGMINLLNSTALKIDTD